VANVTLSLSSFFIGISFGQLLYGPLLERFGRKKPLYAGLCIYSYSIDRLRIGCISKCIDRTPPFAGIGWLRGMVAARAMVRDLFEVKENAKVFSMLMLVVAVSPIIAPTLGGYITSLLGWRYVL
jgi:DHA1 family bicyclomycin/chloramphenicol resistance-like MFS transporter